MAVRITPSTRFLLLWRQIGAFLRLIDTDAPSAPPSGQTAA
jgi:hypothetical protein